LAHVAAAKIGCPEIGETQIRAEQRAVAQIGGVEVGPGQVSLGELDSLEEGPAQADAHQRRLVLVEFLQGLDPAGQDDR